LTSFNHNFITCAETRGLLAQISDVVLLSQQTKLAIFPTFHYISDKDIPENFLFIAKTGRHGLGSFVI